MIETLLLFAFGISALGAGILMLVARDPMRVALALIVTMLSLAGIYALLGVHVIAVFQVLIYVGAVMVFMVYAIMLLDVRDRSYRERFSRWLVPGGIGALALVGLLILALLGAATAPAAVTDSGTFRLQIFASVFLQEFWLHFELISVLLVVAVVAALAILQVGRKSRG